MCITRHQTNKRHQIHSDRVCETTFASVLFKEKCKTCLSTYPDRSEARLSSMFSGKNVSQCEECKGQRQRQTGRDRRTDRQTDRQTGRQAGRQTDRQRQRQRQTERDTERERERVCACMFVNASCPLHQKY